MKMTRTLGGLAGLAMLGVFAATLHAQTSVETMVTNLFEPFGVATDPDGASFVTDSANNRIVKLASGTAYATILAGQAGTTGTNNGIGSSARFFQPLGIVFSRGGLVVADSGNHTLRYITFNGAVSNLAGAPGAFGNANGPAASARFRYPTGLAADTNGNIYIADSQNNAVRKLGSDNVVTTVVGSGLYQPNAVAIGENGELWIADTRRHCIKVLNSNGVVTVVAGVENVSGAYDAVASDALFNLPRGLLWMGSAAGLLIADTGNHAIRRLYYNVNAGTYMVETYAGTLGVSGVADGPALEASFNTPVGLSRDQLSGGFIVADKANNRLRRINTGVVQPPVRDPVIGYVEFIEDIGRLVPHVHPVVRGTFINDIVIAITGEDGTQTHYTFGPTPPSTFEDTIPVPGAGDPTAPVFRDRDPLQPIPPTLVPPQPDVTIKAVGTQSGRRSSAIVQASFEFQVANSVVQGNNAGSFYLDNATTNASIWYTWDGTDPVPGVSQGPVKAKDIISFNLNGQPTLFKARAFKDSYKPSAIVSNLFSPTNFQANEISMGFNGGEASSEFVAAAGQRFYAPITLSLLQGQRMYSFQFNVTATNLTGLPIDGSLPTFSSALVKPVEGLFQVYTPIEPMMFVEFDEFFDPVFTNLVFTNASMNLLGVGWLERYGRRILYDTLAQDLITYSQPHDTLFLSADRKVVLGAYSFVVPSGSPIGSTYRLTIGRASATSDGISKEIYIHHTNHMKTVTVGSRRYVVGDASPFRWFNAGDFGETNLNNSDVMQVFQSAIYPHFYRRPPPGSDMFDAMDSSDGSSNGLIDGSDYSIDSIMFGDGELNVDDIFVTFRRSLDPSLKWYARYWSNGLRQAIEVPNRTPVDPPGASPASAPSKSLTTPTGRPSVALTIDDVVAAPGSIANVPVRVHISGGLPIRVAMLSVTVQPLDGSPALVQSISMNSVLGSPSLTTSPGANSSGCAWLDANVSGVSGSAMIAMLNIPIPSGAGASSAYRVHVEHFSASPNGVGLMRTVVYDGVVTCSSRLGSSWGDAISDLWRLRWYGTTGTLASSPAVDSDGDGSSNLDEYEAGTNPIDARSRFALVTSPALGGVKLTFPTGVGRTYILERSTAPAGPWAPFSTNSGSGDWREVTDSGSNLQFYRVRAQ